MGSHRRLTGMAIVTITGKTVTMGAVGAVMIGRGMIGMALIAEGIIDMASTVRAMISKAMTVADMIDEDTRAMLMAVVLAVSGINQITVNGISRPMDMVVATITTATGVGTTEVHGSPSLGRAIVPLMAAPVMPLPMSTKSVTAMAPAR